MTRALFWLATLFIIALTLILSEFSKDAYWILAFAFPFFVLGIYDMLQKRHSLLRLYPVVGHLRYLMQTIRPQIQQYFIETNTDGMPFSREDRELVYQRANQRLDSLPFGTQKDVYKPGYESIKHSINPKHVDVSEGRVLVGGPACKQPYLSSRLNISAMSFGSLGRNAIEALNLGAKLGNFAHNTGEGGLTPYHLNNGGDITWQIASGYFGCRTSEGRFSSEIFAQKSQLPQVKMIEIKLSQGAKPGHGGVLPAAKISQEIANFRGVEMNKDCVSPMSHPEFDTPKGLLEFLQKLRELSNGKPIGFKLCLGHHSEFLGICKAMLETGIYPDFITVDGKEGGTGAAPVEFVDNVGLPLKEGLSFVHNALVGIGIREHIRIIASGKVISGFDMVSKMILGADICNSARGMMFALGCIQSRRCHTNLCPTGVATQDPHRMLVLNIEDKSKRVFHFHDATIRSFLEVVGTTGVCKIDELQPNFIYRRIDIDSIEHYGEIFDYLSKGQILTGENLPELFAHAWEEARADRF